MIWAITGDIKMVPQEIGQSPVLMTTRYSKLNLIKLRDNIISLKERISLKLTPLVSY